MLTRLRALAVLGLVTLAQGCNGAEGPAATPPADPQSPAASDAAGVPADKPVDPATLASTEGPTNTDEGAADAGKVKDTGAWGPSQVAMMREGPEDSLFETEIHYIQSNEIRHDVWLPYINGRGGAYMGVGSDQNYTLIGAARSEIAFLFDIDRRVVDTHRAYEIFIEASETPDALWHCFDPAKESESVALLESALAGEDEATTKRIVRAYRAGRETLWRHLERVIKRNHEGTPSTWLSDAESYAHVRKLYKEDRIRLMGGDLTGTKTVTTIGAAAKSLGIDFQVVYLSNAEEYFKYVPNYVANIQALHGGEGAVLLRTIYNKNKNKDYVMADSLWHYQVHALADFQERLNNTKVNASRNPMISNAEKEGKFERRTDVPGLSRLATPAPK